jgi:hypothetical protein
MFGDLCAGIGTSIDSPVCDRESFSLEVLASANLCGDHGGALRSRALSGRDAGATFFSCELECASESVVGHGESDGVGATFCGLLGKDWPDDGVDENTASDVAGFAEAGGTSALGAVAALGSAVTFLTLISGWVCGTATRVLWVGVVWGVNRSANASSALDLTIDSLACKGAAQVVSGELMADPVISRVVRGNPAKLGT